MLVRSQEAVHIYLLGLDDIILHERKHYGTVSTPPAGWGNPTGSTEENSRATACIASLGTQAFPVYAVRYFHAHAQKVIYAVRYFHAHAQKVIVCGRTPL